jgi:hypothetical protein
MRRVIPVKRNIIIALLVGIFGIAAVFGLASAVSAQGTTPDTTPAPGWGMGRGGMMASGSYGPMHDGMQAALAEKLGLTVADLQERQAAGQTFWQIAEEKGYTAEEARQMMLDARGAAIDQAVKDGTLTQDQADWMKSRSGRMMGGQVGTGQAGCMGAGTGTGATRGGMMGGRWGR